MILVCTTVFEDCSDGAGELTIIDTTSLSNQKLAKKLEATARKNNNWFKADTLNDSDTDEIQTSSVSFPCMVDGYIVFYYE